MNHPQPQLIQVYEYHGGPMDGELKALPYGQAFSQVVVLHGGEFVRHTYRVSEGVPHRLMYLGPDPMTMKGD